MPNATVNFEDTEKVDLKTCPGGWVLLRRLSYGQILKRRAMSGKLELKSMGKDAASEMQMFNEQITLFEFQNCIVDHNLEDKDGNQLQLSSPIAIQSLHPKIGQEIEAEIAKLNNFDEEVEGEGN